jgi:hypothetical protein
LLHKLYLVTENLTRTNYELIFMAAIHIPLVIDNGTKEPYRSVTWPTNYIKGRAVVPEHCMYQIKTPTEPKENFDVQH